MHPTKTQILKQAIQQLYKSRSWLRRVSVDRFPEPHAELIKELEAMIEEETA